MRDNVGVVSTRLVGADPPKAARRRLFVASLIAAALVFAPHSVRADEGRLKFLSDKMKDSDPRVRTSAALALGASNEDNAVEPLCGGLGDKEDVVRQAAAVALKRLNRS